MSLLVPSGQVVNVHSGMFGLFRYDQNVQFVNKELLPRIINIETNEMLDLLFKPRFGLSLQHLKVEIGCDGDTTQGSEPTHARSETDVSFDRGYEIWFMQQAVKRRADMQLSGLEWGIPGWVAAKGGMWGAENQQYMVGWVSGLLKQKGLNITAVNGDTFSICVLSVSR